MLNNSPCLKDSWEWHTQFNRFRLNINASVQQMIFGVIINTPNTQEGTGSVPTHHPDHYNPPDSIHPYTKKTPSPGPLERTRQEHLRIVWRPLKQDIHIKDYSAANEIRMKSGKFLHLSLLPIRINLPSPFRSLYIYYHLT